MAQQLIGIGTVDNDNTGDDIRPAFDKVNDNFTELYTGAETVAATEKTTPVDADVMPIQDSAGSDVKKKVSWANVKATLKTYFDTLYSTAVKASGIELDTGTDDAKFATAKAIKDAKNVPSVAPGAVGNVLTSDGTDWTSAAGVGAPTQVTGITLSSGSWTLVAGLYEYDYANANITVNSIVDVIPANADIAIVKAAEVLPLTESSAGSVKLYATNAPTGDIGVTINITEKA